MSHDLRADLAEIKFTYCATPLPVFLNDKKFVKVTKVEKIIENALAELHFELFHYSTRARKEDSYQGKTAQILVIKPRVPRPVNAYKRKNVRDGPIRLRPAPSAQQCPQPEENERIVEPKDTGDDLATPATSTSHMARVVCDPTFYRHSY